MVLAPLSSLRGSQEEEPSTHSTSMSQSAVGVLLLSPLSVLSVNLILVGLIHGRLVLPVIHDFLE